LLTHRLSRQAFDGGGPFSAPDWIVISVFVGANLVLTYVTGKGPSYEGTRLAACLYWVSKFTSARLA